MRLERSVPLTGAKKVYKMLGMNDIAVYGISAEEIILVKATGEDAAKRVQEQLDERVTNRMAEFENYLPYQFDIVANYSQVSREGVYVSLIISGELEDLSKIYSGFLNGN